MQPEMADFVKSFKRTANTHHSSSSSSSSSSLSSSSSCSSSKRTKVSVSAPDQLEFLHSNRRRSSVSAGADSRSSSNESLDIVKDRFKLVDLQLEARSETDTSTCINSNKFSRENTPSSELRPGPSSEEMDCPAAKSGSHRRKDRSSATKAPPQAEIEEFFTAAEKYDQKRFADKYNFDIVKDAPLEGRYQWVRLKQ